MIEADRTEITLFGEPAGDALNDLLDRRAPGFESCRVAVENGPYEGAVCSVDDLVDLQIFDRTTTIDLET